MSRRVRLLMAWLILSALWCGAVYHAARMRAQADVHAKASRQLGSFSLALQNELEKYETLPFVMSLQDDLVQSLRRPSDGAQIVAANKYLADVQWRSMVSAAYLVDASGLTIAASNWNQNLSFVGKNYSFRPYMQSALRGQVGRFFGIGTTSGEPGYFLAHPIYAASGSHAPLPGTPLGAVVIKINLEGFERYWATGDRPVALADENGIVFLSNVSELKYRSLQAVDAVTLQAIMDSQQYLGQSLEQLPLSLGSHPQLGRPVEQRVGPLGWRLMLFVRDDAADEDALHAAMAAFLLAGIAGLMVSSVHQRREHIRASLQASQALQEASSQLEYRISMRTHDLLRANAELHERYRQLQQAEQLLRRTQSELVQAGKLGMLGQMAAGVTHELNQPLAAMSAFAENAAAFLDRRDLASVRENLTHISNACNRMSQIIGQLKGFARKSDGQVGPVNLAEAIRNSALLLRRDFENHLVSLDIRIHHNAHVLGDSIRVEQVLVNLLRNALDAVQESDEKSVHVDLRVEQEVAVVRIVDSGSGLALPVLQRLFEPFFTTKPSGRGLGLGLAISSSIVQAMSGALIAENSESGGAVFILKLPLLNPAEPKEAHP